MVTIAVVCRDDETRVQACIRGVQAQDWPPDRLEILVADGMSIDATRETLARLASEDLRIRLLDNPARTLGGGLDECVRHARGEFVVRMDVRADHGPEFVRQCVEELDRTGADRLAGRVHGKAKTFFQRCVVAALASPLGVDRPWTGAFRRSVFERIGMFDPKAVADEDAELDHRIVGEGGRVHDSSEVASYHYPSESMRALGREYFERGRGRARTLLKHGRLRSLRPALPFLCLVGEAALLATSPWHPFGVWSLAAYALATGAEAVRVGRREGVAAVPTVWAIFPVLHVSHGAGFAAGLVKYALRPDWDAPERLWPVEDAESAAAAVT